VPIRRCAQVLHAHRRNSNLSKFRASDRLTGTAHPEVNPKRCNFRVGDNTLCAGINRHVVGDARALQERKQRIHPGLESCMGHREVSGEA
jgi:hypothetical protein